jgi:parallel beta-helix repeat protein
MLKALATTIFGLSLAGAAQAQTCPAGSFLISGAYCLTFTIAPATLPPPPPPPPPPPACAGTAVALGADIQATLNAGATGAAFCFAAGTYRVASPLNPKTAQKLVGAPNLGTILNGSKVVTSFVSSGPNWSATIPTGVADPNGGGVCSLPGCTNPQDVFLDGVHLSRVMSLSALASGTFYQDFTGGKLYLRDNPTGRLVEQAVATAIVQSPNSGIGLSGIVFEKTANAAQHGIIDGQNQGQTGWVVTGNEIRFGHGAGIEVDSATITGNHIHHNGQLGAASHGAGTVFSGNEVDHNNTNGYAQGWEAGGAKFAGNVTNLTVSLNNAHDNAGIGLWCDINCYDATFDSNTVTSNTAGGIFYEISGKAVISNNTLNGNGPSAPNGFYLAGDITVSASSNVEVRGNKASSPVGIGMLQQNRTDTCSYNGSATYPDGTAVCAPGHLLSNVYVHDNVITAPGVNSLAAGMSVDNGDMAAFTSRNNRFVNNTYHLPNLTGYFWTWSNVFKTSATWKAAGQDITGTFLTP